MRDFKSLIVWQKAHKLAVYSYHATQNFPKQEMYGLTSQIRRAASSIAANIAEGCGRDSSPQLRNFLEISLGSASELEYHILLARDLEMLAIEPHQQMNEQVIEVKKMLIAFILKIKTERRT